MQPFTQHTGLVAPLDRANVDTDQIIPKQFLKRIERSGYEDFLFFDWRYGSDQKPDPKFALNRPEFQGASVLLTRQNFGSGSSREHAVWALSDYGFRVVIAPSFADIFYNNCFKNGLLPVVLAEPAINTLFAALGRGTLVLTVDLERQRVTDAAGNSHPFEIDPSRKHKLMLGLDDIALTLKLSDKIKAYEERNPLPAIV
jgi:3-isopropylmalate/(R)-2-methylmalate dehydratase small subunit